MSTNNFELSIRKITDKQLKTQLGMDSDLLHEMALNVTGKGSIKALSISEAADIIDGLVEAGAKVKRKRRPRRDLPLNVIELITCEQFRLIQYLESQLGWDNPNQLKGFIKRIIKREGVRTKQEAIKVIEGL